MGFVLLLVLRGPAVWVRHPSHSTGALCSSFLRFRVFQSMVQGSTPQVAREGQPVPALLSEFHFRWRCGFASMGFSLRVDIKVSIGWAVE